MSRNAHHSRSSRTRANQRSTNSGLAVVFILIVLAALFITFNENWWHIEGVPKWSDLFGSAGLSQSNAKVSDAEVSVHFVDVGQGDCELIMTPDKNILIDCGEKEYKETVISYLKSQNITKLDYVIATHPHSDHIGGMSYIISEFDTETIIMPKLTEEMIPTTSTYTRLIKAISANDINVEYAVAGTRIDLGNDCKMDILAPVNDYDDLNNYSVVMKFSHLNNTFLFTGDIEKEAENDIIASGADLTSKVVKVAHHGSSTSSTKKFIKAVMPTVAVIEVGSPNSYNHPNDGTLERYGNYVTDIYRTDVNGNIVFESDGQNLSVLCSKDGTE